MPDREEINALRLDLTDLETMEQQWARKRAEAEDDFEEEHKDIHPVCTECWIIHPQGECGL